MINGKRLDAATPHFENVYSFNGPPHDSQFSGHVNDAVGTNYMDFPEFRRATGADDPAIRAKIESRVPLGRLGTMDEFAHFCAPFVDGTSRFTTGQFVSYSGGWS